MNVIQANGDIVAGGDIIVGNNNANKSKYLVDCSTEELRQERLHRKNVLRKEYIRVFKVFSVFWAVAAVVLIAAYLWLYFVEGKKELATVCVTLAPLALAFMTFKAFEHPSEHVQRQKAVINEIDLINKERF